MLRILGTLLFSATLTVEPALADSLNSVIKSPHREVSAQRDEYRHPLETITFFDIQPNMTVVEIWPGSGGWYTEILAPYLRDQGKLYAAQFNADSESAFYRNSRAKFEAKLQSDPELYSKVSVVSFNPPTHVDFAPEGSADRILTFRSIHNWYMRGGGDERVLAAFSAFYKALKPGGILGIVEHRLPEARPSSDQEGSGYMHESYVIDLAQRAGFKLLAQSNINANSKDSTLHPEGVWTLPPTLRLGDKQRSHYVSIGESDRMTLKLIKPESSIADAKNSMTTSQPTAMDK